MAKRDYLREFLAEFIEEALNREKEDKNNGYLDSTKIELEADGHVTVLKKYSTGRELYDIKVSKRKGSLR